MKKRITRLVTALTLGVLATTGAAVIDNATTATPQDTGWGAPDTSTPADTGWGTPPADTTIGDTGWG